MPHRAYNRYKQLAEKKRLYCIQYVAIFLQFLILITYNPNICILSACRIVEEENNWSMHMEKKNHLLYRGWGNFHEKIKNIPSSQIIIGRSSFYCRRSKDKRFIGLGHKRFYLTSKAKNYLYNEEEFKK
ncbi:hypothetical protein NEAUS03_2010 [Nematocida ausubeli]|nr:hypothetical protein NEAUS03_2010 [Nematocida ausubeli]